MKDWGRGAFIACALAALTTLGFFAVPGHTYLQSDTQIYIPIFEKLENPKLYQRDILLTAAHVSLTLYDETAIALRRLTRASFASVLQAEQLAFRFLALWGVFLIATSLGFGDAAGLLLAACFGLGADIVGPAVLSVEYEPVPRGFAISFLLLATGLLMHGRYTWACVAASFGVIYHFPSTVPFWTIFLVIVFRERRWKAMWPLGPALALVALMFLLQQGQMRPQPLFTVIDPEWEQIIRMRTAYDWILQWRSGSVLVFIVCAAVSLAALWRIREHTTITQRLVLAGFPLIGLVSLAVSYVLLDLCKWALMAQVQPARAVLFCVVFAQINCALAGFAAARTNCWTEALLWFVPVFLLTVIPANLATPERLATVALLTLLAAATSAKARWLAAPAVAIAGCWAIPNIAHTINYGPPPSPELHQLSEWARSNTDLQSLFVFPAGVPNPAQGVFRAESLRSLYVDWKSGGQVNYFRDFALEWHKRWLELNSGNLTAADWQARGVDYLIYGGPASAQEDPLAPPSFKNANYRAYRLAHRAARLAGGQASAGRRGAPLE